MSAEPVSMSRSVPWSPDPVRQRLGNFTIEDVLALPPDVPRVELRDGMMIVVPSPTIGHQDIGVRLWMWFEKNAPKSYRPALAVGVAVSADTTLEPDVALLWREGVVSTNHYFTPDQVVLAVEVVSPSTRRRDRLEKPAQYADAGVRHYWRIEQDPELHIYAYALGDSGTYELVTDSSERIVLGKPFPIDLDVADLAP